MTPREVVKPTRESTNAVRFDQLKTSVAGACECGFESNPLLPSIAVFVVSSLKLKVIADRYNDGLNSPGTLHWLKEYLETDGPETADGKRKRARPRVLQQAISGNGCSLLNTSSRKASLFI